MSDVIDSEFNRFYINYYLTISAFKVLDQSQIELHKAEVKRIWEAGYNTAIFEIGYGITH